MKTDLSSPPPSAPSQLTSPEEAQVIAQEAYVYLYPLILMDITRKQLLNLDPKASAFGGGKSAKRQPDSFEARVR